MASTLPSTDVPKYIDTINSGGTKDTTTPSKDGSTSTPKTDPKTDPKSQPTKGKTQTGNDLQSKTSQMSKRVSQVNAQPVAKGRTGEIVSTSSARPAKVVFTLPRGMGSGVKLGKK
jgi:hypothetical protein